VAGVFPQRNVGLEVNLSLSSRTLTQEGYFRSAVFSLSSISKDIMLQEETVRREHGAEEKDKEEPEVNTRRENLCTGHF